MSFRDPTSDELNVLIRLANLAEGMSADWVHGLLVADMPDGGMGSLRLLPKGIDVPRPAQGDSVASYEYRDLDDTLVMVQLFVDEAGVPAELDSWRVDFSPILSRGS